MGFVIIGFVQQEDGSAPPAAATRATTATIAMTLVFMPVNPFLYI